MPVLQYVYVPFWITSILELDIWFHLAHLCVLTYFNLRATVEYRCKFGGRNTLLRELSEEVKQFFAQTYSKF